MSSDMYCNFNISEEILEDMTWPNMTQTSQDKTSDQITLQDNTCKISDHMT